MIVSGYFNPLHGGHLNLLEAAARLGDYLIVIVNNDKQQMIKKGKIILDEKNRVRLMGALRVVDEVILSEDTEPPVTETIERIAKKYSEDELIFANGGDRGSEKEIPESNLCHTYGIEMIFSVGDDSKYDSSTRINKLTGSEQ